VHEAYLRLVNQDEQPNWSHRGHFYFAAAEAMRRILIESARRKQAAKRGAHGKPMPLDESLLLTEPSPSELLDLNEALERLEKEHPKSAKLVSLRFFAGLTMSQTADAMGVPLRTLEREWAYAKSWLLEALTEEE
jgi:RNA polymerase sigma factor (TIGR02999 family)